MCKTDSGGNLLYNTGSSNLVLCDDLEEWDGGGKWEEVQERGDMCIPVADSC